MSHHESPASPFTRRHFLRRLASGMIVVTGGAMLGSHWKMDSAAFAEALMQTPWQTEGPFYPDHLPLDTDNDLVIIRPGITPAIGEITHLSGRVTDTRGEPVRGVMVEIWQVDHNGAYIHSRNGNGTHDKFFQGYGRFDTDKNGEYRFRTVKPVPYPGPHATHSSVDMERTARTVDDTGLCARPSAKRARRRAERHS